MSLTDTQRAIHAFIAERIEADGFAPSQAEIARAFGFKGVRTAQYHLEALEAAGIVERSPGRARSLRLLQLPDGPQQLPLPANDDVLQLPVLGQVAAGMPIGADIGSEQVVLMDRTFFSPAPDYLLKVKGVVSGQRYELERNAEDQLRYLAIYEIERADIPESAEWQKAATTPGWMTVRPHITARRRGVFRKM